MNNTEKEHFKKYAEILNKHKNLPEEVQELLKEGQNIYEGEKNYFTISRLHRDDLKNKRFNTENVSDEVMEKLASKMSNDYTEQLFWISMEVIAEDYIGIEKLSEHKYTNILGHRIEWTILDEDYEIEDVELLETDINHIESSIAGGYVEGELNLLLIIGEGEDIGEEEVRGYWKIVK